MKNILCLFIMAMLLASLTPDRKIAEINHPVKIALERTK